MYDVLPKWHALTRPPELGCSVLQYAMQLRPGSFGEAD